MEIFILLLVLVLLSGMVFTFVKACQVVSLEHKVRKLENKLAEIKAHMDMHMRYGKSVTSSTPQNAARPGASTPRPVSSPPRAATAIIPYEPPVPAARKARQPAAVSPAFSWEYFIGAKLLSWIGGFILFLGTGFFVKYSIDNELISPEWRIILTYLTAFALLGTGLSRLKKRYPTLSGTLTATGILVLYLATCAGRMFYALPFFNTAVSAR